MRTLQKSAVKASIVSIFLSTLYSYCALPEKKIVVQIASYNNKDWYRANLDSIFMQKYDNYRVIYTDDCSTDGTYELVRDYIKERGQEHRVTLIHNEKRVGAMANHYRAIHSCNDKEIVVKVDGDDLLAHEYVLYTVNKVYADSRIWLMYSQFLMWPSGTRGWNRMYDKAFIDRSRDRGYAPAHLRTFYAGLFKKIDVKDFMYEGNFLQMTCDMAMMLPMMEMARNGHIYFLPYILYIYNEANPLNDHKVSKDLQRKLDLYLRSKEKYAPLEELFPLKVARNRFIILSELLGDEVV